MKLFAIAAVLVAGFVTSAAADPLEGRWRTVADDNGNSGLVEVTPCGEKLCGVLIQAFGPNGQSIQSDNIGRFIIWDTENRGDGEYRGRVYSPDRDKEYASKLILSGDSLAVSGCVLGICRNGGSWQRAR
jgi:uncharacterized protein (DUF2147 family)